MKKISITPQARADLRDIGRYTDKKWGRQQRFTYIRQLTDRFAYLAENPHRGRKPDELVGSPLSYHEGRHIIFYRFRADGIEVLRILHDSMDFLRHFK